MKRLIIIVVVMVALAIAARAQEQDPLTVTPGHPNVSVSTPKLTEVQILKVQNLAQRIELAQLRAALAQQEYERAREAASALVKSLQVEGYDLDLERFVYVPKPPAANTP